MATATQSQFRREERRITGQQLPTTNWEEQRITGQPLPTTNWEEQRITGQSTPTTNWEEQRITGQQLPTTNWEEQRITGQQLPTTNWEEHLDGLLTELQASLPTGRTALSAAEPPPQHALPGSEEFHERREFRSPDRRTHTVQEHSSRTERSGGGGGGGGGSSGQSSQVVSRKVIRSQSSSRTTQRSTVSPEPPLHWTVDTVDSATPNRSLADDSPSSTGKDATTVLCGFNGLLPAMELPAMEVPPPVPGTQSRVSRYEYRRSSQRSISPVPAPAPARRQGPPPPPPRAQTPAGLSLQDAATTTDGQPATTTINYHIYNYGTEPPPATDSGLGTLERAGLWQGSSGAGRQGTAACPAADRSDERWNAACPAADRSDERWAASQMESTTEQLRRYGRPAGPLPGSQTAESQLEGTSEQLRRYGRPASPLPGSQTVETRLERRDETPLQLQTERRTSEHRQQDVSYPDGPRRGDTACGTVSESRSLPLVTESDAGQTPTTPTPTPSQYCSSPPADYRPPTDQIDCQTKFHTKEKGKDGNTRTHFEASGEYKAKGGSKQAKENGGKTIPICLPCCAGAPCTVM